MDPPSPQLVHTLTSLGLVNRADFARCRPLVKQFSQDLPTFDSVWVDALVRSGVLTPFQSRQLYENGAESLRAGDWVLFDRLRRSPRLEVFRARHDTQGTEVTLTRYQSSAVAASDSVAALHEAIRLRTHIRHGVLWPTAAFVDHGACWIVSPLVEGQSLAELLIRRGRFPSDVVEVLLRQMLLLWLDSSGPQSRWGTPSTDQFWLTAAGELQLLHPGLWELLEPDTLLLGQRPLESLNGIPPELLDPLTQNSQTTTASTVYSLGCICWELLVGRPPFPVADPLQKLAAHRTQHVPGLRDWAPETPLWFQELIATMTSRSPAQRPAPENLLVQLKSSPGTGRLRSFQNSQETAAARPILSAGLATPSAGKRNWTQPVAAALALALLGGGLWWGPSWLQKSGSLLSPPASATTNNRVERVAPSDLIPLPEPNPQGEVQLSAGRYQIRDLDVEGHLVVRGPNEGTATLILNGPTIWSAQRILVSNLEVERGPLASTTLSLRSQEFRLEQVHATGNLPSGSDVSEQAAVFDWQIRDLEDATAGHLELRNCRFLECGPLLRCSSPPAAIRFDNVLVTGTGTVLQIAGGLSPGHSTPLELHHSTFRDTGPVVGWFLTPPLAGQLSIHGSQTVLALAEKAPLIEFSQGPITASWTDAVQINAADLILANPSPLAAYRFPEPAGEIRPLETRRLQVDGLLTGTVIFQGPKLGESGDSTVVAAETPLSSSAELPGYQPVTR